MIRVRTSLFGFLLLLTPILVDAHYGPDYTPPVESSRSRTLSLQSQQSTAGDPYDYLIKNSSGVPKRWVGADNGSKIKYYLDIEYKPGSFTTFQCRSAARQAFQAWTDICGVDFIFSGFIYTREPLADFFENNEGFDDSIIIQMHETYADITAEDSYLASAGTTSKTLEGSGGRFKGVEFTKSLKGRIYFNHDNLFWNDVSFERLCSTMKHEIGHILGLMHSNYDPSTGEEVHMPVLTEENSYQRQSIMYYQNYDGRDFGQWDTDHIKLLYDKNNHVPFSNSDHGNESLYYPYSSYFSENNINFFTFNIGDLDNDELSIVEVPDYSYIYSGASNYLNGDTLEVRINGSFASGEWTRSNDLSWHRFAYRVQDSLGNMSPIYYLKINKFISDYNSNGLSDIWETNYGIYSTSSSRNHDSDNDLVSDYDEYLTDTDPTNNNSFDPTLRQLGLAQNGVLENPSQYNLFTMNEIQDLRAGSTMIEVEDGQATLSMEVEQSSDLEIWTSGGTTNLQIPVDPNSDTKFFRFKMAE